MNKYVPAHLVQLNQRMNLVHQTNYLPLHLPTPNDSNPIKTPQFAVVDLDGDGVSEVVLAIEDYNRFIILRYKEGRVYGFIVSYRSMFNLKADGSFMTSSSSSDTSVGKMLCIG